MGITCDNLPPISPRITAALHPSGSRLKTTACSPRRRRRCMPAGLACVAGWKQSQYGDAPRMCLACSDFWHSSFPDSPRSLISLSRMHVCMYACTFRVFARVCTYFPTSTTQLRNHPAPPVSCFLASVRPRVWQSQSPIDACLLCAYAVPLSVSYARGASFSVFRARLEHACACARTHTLKRARTPALSWTGYGLVRSHVPSRYEVAA